MQITIEKRFIKLPVNQKMQPKRLLFKDQRKIVADLVTAPDPVNPNFWYYWDARELLGRTLELIWEPALDYLPEFADEVPVDGIYQEQYRPVSHFSAARGWINDPNGLVFYEGKYHMFFQHNPVASVWGNMHWGHAVSTDLVHWEEKETALFPDETGTMFSGSAIVDKNNVTGLKENEHDPLLLFYTAAGNTGTTSRNQRFTQCMAFSTDGGNTFRKYHQNPVVPHIVGDNRDPKVIYNDDDNSYYMALYLTDDEYALLTSHNLLDWKLSQKLSIPGDAECPDLFPLTTASGKKYWILMGASDRYLVGFLGQGHFHPVQEAKSLQIRGKSYAAQTFSNIPDGRILRMGWNQSSIPDSIFNSSMCTPAELSLSESNHDLWLCIHPAREFDILASSADHTAPLSGISQDIHLELQSTPHSETSISLFGLTLHISEGNRRLNVNKLSLPLFSENGIVKLRIITDVHATEIYVADGQIFTCVDHIADGSLNRLEITGSSTIKALQIRTLDNIWKK